MSHELRVNWTWTIVYVALASVFGGCVRSPEEPAREAEFEADVIIVGTGIAGLAAAVELGRNGINVLAVDMNSMPGGHAVMAGGFAVAESALQKSQGFEDSPELAFRDWMSWSEGSGDPEWMRFYAENSNELIYEWIEEMGAKFVRIVPSPDNSVPRFHYTARGSLDVVLAFFRTALELPSVSFKMNHLVDELVIENGRVIGVQAIDLRSGQTWTFRAPYVVLSTGGFEADLERVRDNWLPDLPEPDTLLIGSSAHAKGQGLDLASDAGANLVNLDRQFIYVDGTVDPRDPTRMHAITVGNKSSLWLNSDGQRFTNERGFDKSILKDLLNQEPATYWAIFDELGRGDLSMRGKEWIATPMTTHPLLDDPSVTQKSLSLTSLADSIDLPKDAVVSSVERYNRMIDAGVDADFGRFDTADVAPTKIETPPFYAIQMYPMTRKSMGGVAIDRDGHTINSEGEIIPGLYAAGELTGSVGINGKHGMEGMFLGPAVLTARLVAQSIVAEHSDGQKQVATTVQTIEEPLPNPDTWEVSLTAVDLAALLATPRDGYWHFQISHEMVLEREYECIRCHSAEVPFYPINNRQSKQAQTQLCYNCHGR